MTSPTQELDAPALRRLAPYLVGSTRRGVVGGSRYAVKLRAALAQAAQDPARLPVLISGEPGLEKDNLAALVHFGSGDRRHVLIRVDTSLLRADGGDLFHGSPSQGPPLLECLGQGCVLLDRFDAAPPELRALLIELARTGQWPGCSEPFQGRLLFTAESSVPELEGLCDQIRVPPLRVRRQDLGDWIRYSLRRRARQLGWPKPPQVPANVVKRLQSHDFPNNLRELDVVINRALLQAKASAVHGELPDLLPEDVFWLLSRPTSLRFDIWRWKPRLREWMRAPLLWNGLLFGLVSWLFVLVNGALWLGPQDRAHNGALNLF